MKILFLVVAFAVPVFASAGELRTRDVAPNAAKELAEFYDEFNLTSKQRMKLGEIVNRAVNESSQTSCLQVQPSLPKLICEWKNIPFGFDKLSFMSVPVTNEKEGLEDIISQVDKEVRARGLQTTGRQVVQASLARYPLDCHEIR